VHWAVLAIRCSLPLEPEFLQWSKSQVVQMSSADASSANIAVIMKIELFKAALGLLVSVITLALGWLVGQRLTMNWNLVQKLRETEIENIHQFHLVYGEFRELSKTWRLVKKDEVVAEAERPGIRWILLTRACALESKVESINIKLATEKMMHDENLRALGLFRQAIQRLRESVRDETITPSSSRGIDYEYFNHLAARVATLISCAPEGPRPDAERSSKQLSKIANVTLQEFDDSLALYTKNYLQESQYF